MGRREGEMGSVARMMILIIGVMSTVNSTPDTNITSVLCNSGSFTAGDPFSISLSYVLTDLESSTPSWKNYDYYNISPYPNAFALGHATCNSTLTSTNCKTCLGAAKQVMLTTCPKRIGSRSVLYDCSIRYEQYPFTD